MPKSNKQKKQHSQFSKKIKEAKKYYKAHPNESWADCLSKALKK